MFLNRFTSYASIFEPSIISIGLLNIKDIGLYKNGVPDWDFPGYIPQIWQEENHIILPPMQLNLIDDSHKTAKLFADRVWNAFGFEKAHFFDEDGKFTLGK